MRNSCRRDEMHIFHFHILFLFPKRNMFYSFKIGKAMFAVKTATNALEHRSGNAPVHVRGKKGERTMSNKNNNQLNIPQAKAAMEQFKMQAAQEEDVFSTS